MLLIYNYSGLDRQGGFLERNAFVIRLFFLLIAMLTSISLFYRSMSLRTVDKRRFFIYLLTSALGLLLTLFFIVVLFAFRNFGNL